MMIRSFTPADQQATQQLILSGLVEYWGELDSALNSDLNNIPDSYQSGYFVVAEQDSEIVGCGAMIPSGSQRGQIVRMSVDSKMRRLGIGRKILDVLIEFAKTRGYTTLILETTETWTGAIAFYMSYGFEPTHVTNGDQYFSYNLIK